MGIFKLISQYRSDFAGRVGLFPKPKYCRTHWIENTLTTLKPSDRLHCLLVQPKFEESNFWNFVEGARAIGAKATASPLGLLTVAAMLPEHWDVRGV